MDRLNAFGGSFGSSAPPHKSWAWRWWAAALSGAPVGWKCALRFPERLVTGVVISPGVISLTSLSDRRWEFDGKHLNIVGIDECTNVSNKTLTKLSKHLKSGSGGFNEDKG